MTWSLQYYVAARQMTMEFPDREGALDAYFALSGQADLVRVLDANGAVIVSATAASSSLSDCGTHHTMLQ